ncbi:MAG: hypothetical protein WC378_01420 [Opitutaceae bacterium]|jgi:hypothetical protein
MSSIGVIDFKTLLTGMEEMEGMSDCRSTISYKLVAISASGLRIGGQ